MINLKYSLIIEATKDPTFFTFYSPDIEGFTGVGRMEEHLNLLKERKMPIPKANKNPEIIIRNENKSNIAVGKISFLHSLHSPDNVSLLP